MESINHSEATDMTAQEPLPGLSEISILLDSYDDIFSDFDPSPYSERTISDDFIVQSKKLSRNKSGHKMLLKLLLPADKRNESNEKTIIKRLHAYFKNGYQQSASEIKRNNRRGLFLTITGILLLMAAGYISLLDSQKYYIHLLFVLTEPAGWFLLWAGLDQLVYSPRELKKDLEYYRHMSKADIRFFTH